MPRNNIDRLKQLLQRTKEYKDLFFNSSDRDAYFYSDDAEVKREDLIKRYEELKELIIEANGGIPYASLFGQEGVDIFANSYSSSNDTAAFHCLKLAPEIITKTIAYWGGKKIKVPETNPKKSELYIKKEIITGFQNKGKPFDYTKLISLINGLNNNYSDRDAYTCSVLIRAIIDIIPPLLGLTTFNEVVSQYGWGETNGKYMKMLLDFKNDGDGTLHNQISEDKDFLGIDKITMLGNILNILLQECLKRGGLNELTKAKEQRKLQSIPLSKINVTIVEEKNDGWQNYSIGFYMGYSFKFVLNVDNFNSNKPDYLTLSLKATNADGKAWESSHFIFETEKPEQNVPFKIDASEEKKVTVVLSDQEFSHNNISHRFKPDLDRDTMILCVNTKSGKIFDLPVKAKIV
ncbi:MAG: hypothetical protein WC895_04330 [Candidatus Shapirobacteria bacterium]|jgi:hypothetical protein